MKFERIGLQLLVVLLVFVISDMAVAVDKPTVEPKTCVTAECHGNYSQKKFLHGPVVEKECGVCHESSDPAKHSYVLAEKGRELCESCHLDQASKKNVHKPLKDGDCLQCHDPHASNNKKFLVKDTVGDLCAGCHKNVTQKKHLHGPVAVGQCSVCHNAHSSDNDHLLSVEPKKLCIACHTTTKKEMDKFEFVHKATDGQCFGCHDPHGADNWKMLRAEAPEMCYSCHEDIKNRAENSKHKHGVIKEKGSCLICHTPHASTVKYILKDAPIKLCLNCHNKPLGVSKDDVIPAFTSQIEGKKFKHGPVDDNDCAGCHKTHGSDHFRMLENKYPAFFYAPFDKKNYELCFGCHEDTVVENERTEELTDFRNGDLNLHYLHVNKERRGRTCRACHQTHASNHPKHIRESVPYGQWDLPIGFSKTETGGSCAPGCHVAKNYDRDKAVDYSFKAESEEKGK
ncbi:MAG: cytochrome c3 family protein [Phycisphaerae bacterium]|nr:cytochrome c3 family protein [Phycisphaerae bacterium]